MVLLRHRLACDFETHKHTPDINSNVLLAPKCDFILASPFGHEWRVVALDLLWPADVETVHPSAKFSQQP